jgi:hypothetical protein
MSASTVQPTPPTPPPPKPAPKVVRTVIQIAVSDHVPNETMGPTLYALCDDGTMWSYTIGRYAGKMWVLMPEVPQA